MVDERKDSVKYIHVDRISWVNVCNIIYEKHAQEKLRFQGEMKMSSHKDYRSVVHSFYNY